MGGGGGISLSLISDNHTNQILRITKWNFDEGVEVLYLDWHQGVVSLLGSGQIALSPLPLPSPCNLGTILGVLLHLSQPSGLGTRDHYDFGSYWFFGADGLDVSFRIVKTVKGLKFPKLCHVTVVKHIFLNVLIQYQK